MAEQRPGAWFGFGFCGFGQALGRGRGPQVSSPEPLPGGAAVRCVSAAWSYTAVVTRGGRVELSGSASGAADGCRAVWASEGLLVVLGGGPGPEEAELLQAWAPESALRGEPLWAQKVLRESEAQAGLRARRLELGAEHALLLDTQDQVFSWGGGGWR
ncbi:RCC1 domain-containing protein 1-like [Ochotona princeps]|uniref:RCC1 domain-containing protein 1-like n=1 Tax=Ochotona princeps TaxID=9978 RepID=UPI0027146D89|nr:RCC1 domain-containing protein 1-like [Ochotona princeps]